MLLALLGHRADRRNFIRQFPAHFILEDFRQRDVGQTHAGGHIHERTPQAAAAGIELAHAARDEIHEHVGVAHFFHGTFAKFSVHNVLFVQNRVVENNWLARESNTIKRTCREDFKGEQYSNIMGVSIRSVSASPLRVATGGNGGTCHNKS